ncbi:hypothetical protein Adt_39677 [Abeliophyllum distichum]|uniref:Uncharacterized protein n=1 Tax=Abeliophyllum distichum TaxID=126358 RepID=A0ABD1Q5U8_9LAMI
MRLVEKQVRFIVPPCYPSWIEVLKEQQACLHSIIETYFDLQDDRSSDEYPTVYTVVDRLAANCYRDYKLKERSTKNNANRGKAKYSSVQGSKSFSTTRYDQDKLIKNRETQQIQVASIGASVDECATTKEVLGERRGHVRGVGCVSKGTSSSPDSITASNPPERKSNQFSKDPLG